MTVKSESIDPYTYYDNHNWGENSKVDEYIFDNYWYEEIYDELDDPENEVWDIWKSNGYCVPGYVPLINNSIEL